ncbi:acyl-CoA thioesterase [Mycolicibacterium moriokaense]|uniref:Acyl-CoA thioesterase n=1 Tax=Mycolicibacterium moriokaense TaxID=39691 RepID=A0A318HK10_9MYCO|nr:thioesterase family protein [Mycolicibacterium moriokaense]PXX06298.1 acyl-CoA thioesterase [Mycolicibacterium moriokaense]
MDETALAPKETPHPFDSAVELTPSAPGLSIGHTSPAYNNIVGPYGGITAATLLKSVQQHPERLGEPLSLTVNFAGPITEGIFQIAARPVRTNRSTQHWWIELSQEGAVAATATAVFGTRRGTWSSTEITMPAVPAADDVAPLPFPEFIAWSQNYEMRFVAGSIPDSGTGHPDSTTTLWVRDIPARALDYTSLTALCDVFFPRVFLRRGKLVPAGTVSMTTYFHADAAALAKQSDSAVLATARTQRFGNGYFDQAAEVWGSGGELLAVTQQLVYFKD